MRVLVSSRAQGRFHRTKFCVFTGKAHSSTRGLQDQIGDLLWVREKR
jgi:hypothetical protein